MKKILIAAILFTGCATEKTYVVKSYAESNGMWVLQTQVEGKKKQVEFTTDCPPDSVGARFKASRKDFKVYRPRN